MTMGLPLQEIAPVESVHKETLGLLHTGFALVKAPQDLVSGTVF